MTTLENLASSATQLEAEAREALRQLILKNRLVAMLNDPDVTTVIVVPGKREVADPEEGIVRGRQIFD